MTESTAAKHDPFATIPAAQASEVPEVQSVAVTTNPGLIPWPTDRWGYTSKLRKAFTLAAATVRGQPDKQELLLAHLDLMRGHLVARFEKDAADAVKSRADAERFAADRIKRNMR